MSPEVQERCVPSCDIDEPPTDAKRTEGARLSYADAVSSPLGRSLVRGLEAATGARRIARLYERLPAKQAEGLELWTAVCELLELEVVVGGRPPEQIPATGPLVVVANHPFGVADGAVACRVVGQIRQDFRLLAIDLLRQLPETAPWVLPIDFQGQRASVLTNLQTRAASIAALREGRSLILFPAGEVATATHPFGKAREGPWHPFLGRLLQATSAEVLPLFFPGQNSWAFHLASKFGTAARMALFMHETRRRIGSRIEVIVGDVIRRPELDALVDRTAVVQYVRERTLALGRRQADRRRRSPSARPGENRAQ